MNFFNVNQLFWINLYRFDIIKNIIKWWFINLTELWSVDPWIELLRANLAEILWIDLVQWFLGKRYLYLFSDYARIKTWQELLKVLIFLKIFDISSLRKQRKQLWKDYIRCLFRRSTSLVLKTGPILAQCESRLTQCQPVPAFWPQKSYSP